MSDLGSDMGSDLGLGAPGFARGTRGLCGTLAHVARAVCGAFATAGELPLELPGSLGRATAGDLTHVPKTPAGSLVSGAKTVAGTFARIAR